MSQCMVAKTTGANGDQMVVIKKNRPEGNQREPKSLFATFRFYVNPIHFVCTHTSNVIGLLLKV